MANGIIVILIVALLAVAVKNALKHFRGEALCCGGGGDSEVIENKVLDGAKIGEKVVTIEGMHCQHCVKQVTHAINKIDGAAAQVNLKKNCAVVSFDRPIDESAIKIAVENAGFQVRSIR